MWVGKVGWSHTQQADPQSRPLSGHRVHLLDWSQLRSLGHVNPSFDLDMLLRSRGHGSQACGTEDYGAGQGESKKEPRHRRIRKGNLGGLL